MIDPNITASKSFLIPGEYTGRNRKHGTNRDFKLQASVADDNGPEELSLEILIGAVFGRFGSVSL